MIDFLIDAAKTILEVVVEVLKKKEKNGKT